MEDRVLIKILIKSGGAEISQNSLTGAHPSGNGGNGGKFYII
jgi:hypothetical protein